jgi:predicted RNase H-like nuclease (RuvC/YqgF family)
MSTSNYPSATPQSQPPRRDSKNLIIGLLAVGILGTWGYFLWDKNKNDQKITQLQSSFVAVDSSKNELQKSFDASLARLDSLTGYNNELEGKLTERNSDISKLKSQINGILKKQRITAAEKKKAEELIAELNSKINGLEEEVQRLTQENQTLTTEKAAVTVERDTYRAQKDTLETVKKGLEDKVNVASTLNAYGITITPVNEKSGGREKVTTNAKRVDKLVIAFDVDNRIADAGATEVFVAITDPEGKPVSVEALGSGTFTTREEGEKPFTAKVPVEIETGKKKHVEFAWKQNSAFKRGAYKIEIYHNGFKIGEGVRELKKGGLFG